MNKTNPFLNEEYFKIIEIIAFSVLSFIVGVIYGKYSGTRIN